MHNKKHNIKNNENEQYKNIDISNENEVLNSFIIYFKHNYFSIIGDHLYGLQKSVFNCQNCNGNTINFKVFNLLILY